MAKVNNLSRKELQKALTEVMRREWPFKDSIFVVIDSVVLESSWDDDTAPWGITTTVSYGLDPNWTHSARLSYLETDTLEFIKGMFHQIIVQDIDREEL